MTLLTATLTHPGGRAINQDRLAQAAANGLSCWALADGLGGHGGGELAAQLAVDAVAGRFQANPGCSAEALQDFADAANRAVLAGQKQNPAQLHMRSTLTILVATGEQAMWAHVGDTRLYYFHGGRVARQTKDHSVPQALVDSGEISPAQIRHHEDRNRLLRSLGSDEALRLAVSEPAALAEGDALLLASDGFWEYVTEAEMEVDLAKSANATDWLSHMTARLRSRTPPDHDNYSAIAITVH